MGHFPITLLYRDFVALRIDTGRVILCQCFANVRIKFTSCQRCVSDKTPFHGVIHSFPFVIVQKSEPSVSAPMSVLSAKFAGLGVQPAAHGPSPRPVCPWHGAQYPLNSFCACFKFSAEGGTGFFTSLALCGAPLVHATVPAHSRSANIAVTCPSFPNWKLLQTQLSLPDQEPRRPEREKLSSSDLSCHGTGSFYQSDCAVEAINFLINATVAKRGNRKTDHYRRSLQHGRNRGHCERGKRR